MENRYSLEDQDPQGVSIRLLKNYQAGDPGALNELLQRISPRILLSVRSRRDRNLRSKLDSMDILQEVMQDALPQLKTLEVSSEGGLIHWFSSLISGHIADQADYFHRDKRSISKEIPLDGAFGRDSQDVISRREPQSPDLTPSGVFMISERIRHMEEAIEKLPSEYQDVIHYRNIEGLSFTEVAQLMNRNFDAVRMLYHRAIKLLTKQLIKTDKE